MAAPYDSRATLQSLIRVANALREDGPACRLAPLVLMSDRGRTPDIVDLARRMPPGSAVVYRERPGRHDPEVAASLRAVTHARGVQLLIGADADLAARVGADGVHLPRGARQAAALRREHPDWIISQAAPKGGVAPKDGPEMDTRALDAVMVSSVFGSNSPSAGTPLGVGAFKGRVAASPVPVFALGGVAAETAPALTGTGASGLAAIDGLARLLRDPVMPVAPNPPNKGQTTIQARDAADVSITKEEGGEMIRYAATVAGAAEEGELTLRRVADGVWNANHTGVPNSIGGRGVGTALAEAMVEDARAQGWRIIPGCPFVAKLFERRPELAQGIT